VRVFFAGSWRKVRNRREEILQQLEITIIPDVCSPDARQPAIRTAKLRWRQFMKILYRVLVSLLMMLAMLLLASCNGAPGCPQVSFGVTPACAAGGGGTLGGGGTGGGGGGGGGGGNTAAAYVYAVDQNGLVDGYDLSTSGATFQAISGYSAPTIPTGDPGVGMVVVKQQFVYALFEDAAAQGIYGWSIDSTTGALTQLANFPLGIALNLPLVDFNQYNVTTDPGGNYLFIANSSLNEILVYSIDSTTGALTAVGSPITTTIEPGNLATDGLGLYLYVCAAGAEHNGTTILGYTIGSGGVLAAIPGGAFATPPAGIWQLQGDATGKYMIGTSGSTASLGVADDKQLYVFSIDQTTGVLTQAAGSPVTTTYSPFTIAMQPPASAGEFVYSFSINDTATGYNPIEGFQLDPTTGTLTALTNSPFSGVFLGQWGQFDQLGTNLLVYSNVFNGTTTTTEIGALVVDSTGTLTQPISPATLTTPGYWVVTDP
jgi:6-phosphogluconolactonase (cycloisomerase 2 family)